MRNHVLIYFSVLIGILAFFYTSCSKENVERIEFKREYFPIETGHWITYKVDLITYSDVTNPATIDTSTYYRKEQIELPFTDLEGNTAYKYKAYHSEPDTNSWNIEYTGTLSDANGNIEKVEKDYRFVKLIFPPAVGVTWDGHTYINVTDQDADEYLNPDRYDWTYTYQQVDQPFSLNGFNFDSTLTVVQIDEENLFEKKYGVEIYAKHIGLVYKELLILETQLPPTGQSFLERAQKGFILRYSIYDYKR